jgi:hypothetical protein
LLQCEEALRNEGQDRRYAPLADEKFSHLLKYI